MCFIFSSHFVYANEGGLFSNLRPYIVKYLGEDMANTLLGEKAGVGLPPIPVLKDETKSTDVYKNKKKETVTYSPDKMHQYNLSYVNEVIETTREIKATRNDLAKWMNTLSQGATREGVYRAMVLDTFYARMENYDAPLSNSAVDFTIYFMNKYTGRKLTQERLKGFNIYSIKRIMTEKSLDILDHYLRNNEEDFYNWYAHFSSEIAKDFTIWENKLRGTKDSHRHKAWAKKVPKQFVKSEVIIKLHKLMNNLQKRSN